MAFTITGTQTLSVPVSTAFSGAVLSPDNQVAFLCADDIGSTAVRLSNGSFVPAAGPSGGVWLAAFGSPPTVVTRGSNYVLYGNSDFALKFDTTSLAANYSSQMLPSFSSPNRCAATNRDGTRRASYVSGTGTGTTRYAADAAANWNTGAANGYSTVSSPPADSSNMLYSTFVNSRYCLFPTGVGKFRLLDTDTGTYSSEYTPAVGSGGPWVAAATTVDSFVACFNSVSTARVYQLSGGAWTLFQSITLPTLGDGAIPVRVKMSSDGLMLLAMRNGVSTSNTDGTKIHVYRRDSAADPFVLDGSYSLPAIAFSSGVFDYNWHYEGTNVAGRLTFVGYDSVAGNTKLAVLTYDTLSVGTAQFTAEGSSTAAFSGGSSTVVSAGLSSAGVTSAQFSSATILRSAFVAGGSSTAEFLSDSRTQLSVAGTSAAAFAGAAVRPSQLAAPGKTSVALRVATIYSLHFRVSGRAAFSPAGGATSTTAFVADGGCRPALRAAMVREASVATDGGSVADFSSGWNADTILTSVSETALFLRGGAVVPATLLSLSAGFGQFSSAFSISSVPPLLDPAVEHLFVGEHQPEVIVIHPLE